MGIKPIETPIFGNPEGARQLREIADQIESGEIRDIVVVADKKNEKLYFSWGLFSDRWRILGAIEYAKAYVTNRDGDDD